jgi:hypothetical protein
MRVVLAAGIAVVIAVTLAVPSIAGIATWKWVLGVLGLALIVLAGRGKSA